MLPKSYGVRCRSGRGVTHGRQGAARRGAGSTGVPRPEPSSGTSPGGRTAGSCYHGSAQVQGGASARRGSEPGRPGRGVPARTHAWGTVCLRNVGAGPLHRQPPRTVPFALIFVATFSFFAWFAEVPARGVSARPRSPPPAPPPPRALPRPAPLTLPARPSAAASPIRCTLWRQKSKQAPPCLGIASRQSPPQ